MVWSVSQNRDMTYADSYQADAANRMAAADAAWAPFETVTDLSGAYVSGWNPQNDFFTGKPAIARPEMFDFQGNPTGLYGEKIAADAAYSESQRIAPPNDDGFFDKKFMAFALIAGGALAATGGMSGSAAASTSTASTTAPTAYFGGINATGGGVTGMTAGAAGQNGLTIGAGTTLGSGTVEAAIAGGTFGAGAGYVSGGANLIDTAKTGYSYISKGNQILKLASVGSSSAGAVSMARAPQPNFNGSTSTMFNPNNIATPSFDDHAAQVKQQNVAPANSGAVPTGIHASMISSQTMMMLGAVVVAFILLKKAK